MKIKITADSTCDLSPQLIEKYGIKIAPLYVIKDETAYKDGLEIAPQDIFDHVNAGGICRTSAVNIVDYEGYFHEWMDGYDAIIHFCISSDMSACWQNANLVASELENVYVIDSRNLSTGIGLLVIEAAEMAARGMQPKEICAKLDELINKAEVSFVIDTLKFLHVGGRCSGVAALGANLLQLKPCIEVNGGKMDVAKKYRGAFDAVVAKYVGERVTGRDDIDLKRAFITHSCISEAPVKAAEDLCREAGFEEILITRAGCTVSNHCGPNCLGVLFFKK